MFAATKMLLTPPPTSTVTPVSLKGTPNLATGTTSVTIPTHAAGDIIVIFAYLSDASVIPSLPSAGGTVPAWVTVDSGTSAGGGGGGSGSRTAYFVATASNTTSGSWGSDGTTEMIAVVLTGQGSTPIGGHAEADGGSIGGSVTAPSITMSQTDGTSMLLHFFGYSQGGRTWNAAPAGYTKQKATTSSVILNAVCFDTKNSTTSDGSVTQTNDGLASASTRAQTVEIRAH